MLVAQAIETKIQKNKGEKSQTEPGNQGRNNGNQGVVCISRQQTKV